ncbi:hypothetical protein KRMM14A1004_41650 [Krasilnikovia sp. MM14-A1004]
MGENDGRRRGVFPRAGVVNTVSALSGRPGAGGRVPLKGVAEETSDSRTSLRSVEPTAWRWTVSAGGFH